MCVTGSADSKTFVHFTPEATYADYTVKHNFCHMKTNLCVLMYFSKLNSNMLLELLYHSKFLCERIFLNAISFCHATSMVYK